MINTVGFWIRYKYEVFRFVGVFFRLFFITISGYFGGGD